MPHYNPSSDTDNGADEYPEVFPDTRVDHPSTSDGTNTAHTDNEDSDHMDAHNKESVTNGNNNGHPAKVVHCEADNKEGLGNNKDIRDKDVPEKPRAASARDLVKSQEKLILMLQSMRTDLSKMDREATSIKEEVVRSRQLFDVVVGHRRVHQLDYSANGYNLTYAIPKTSYNTCKRRLEAARRSSLRLGSQLASYYQSSSDTSRMSDEDSRRSPDSPRTFSDSSQRSNMSGRPSSYKKEIEYFVSRFHANDDQGEQSHSEYSETESEYDSAQQQTWSHDPTGSRSDPTGSRRTISRRSRDYYAYGSDSSVTDSSAEEVARKLAEQRQKRAERRSSYYFAQKAETPPPELSDDVCL